MGKFSLNQVITTDRIMYPIADYPLGDWSKHGEATAWACLDDTRKNPDDDTTYIYSECTDPDTQWCCVDTPTDLTGNINYVLIFCRAKTDVSLGSGGEFLITLNLDSTCTETPPPNPSAYESEPKTLTGEYKNFTYFLTQNPSTSTDWSWDDFNEFMIGVYANNPLGEDKNTKNTITADGNGDTIQLNRSSENANWECVFLGSGDGNHVYNFITTSSKYDIYTLESIVTDAGWGEINHLTVFTRVKNLGNGSFDVSANQVIKTNGSVYHASSFTIPYTDTWKSYTWSTNPNTGNAWTWNEINNLQAGIRIGKTYFTGISACYEMYVIINYYSSKLPEIRVTQLHAIVNYNDELDCELNKPEEISTSHSRNTKMLNFWNGEREVYDLNRTGYSMVLRGVEYEADEQFENTPCDRIECVREMGRNGETITVSELVPRIFNGDYKIRGFYWQEISSNPQVIRWMLDLEKNDL